jgi:predicted alpha/beta superfamily hydrolase
MKLLKFVVFIFCTFYGWSQTPFSIGVIDTIYSAELQENRIINIYIPKEFSSDSTKVYNIVYLLDGSADEDFIHVAGLVQFCNFSWIDALPPSIVVGISNVDRKRDFTFPTNIEKDKIDFPTTGGSAKFISFLEKELKPYIEKSYPCSGDNMLIGQSLGGLLATEILVSKTTMFNQYVIVSPSLWWDNQSLLENDFSLLKTSSLNELNVHIAIGNEGRVMVRDAKQLRKKLRKLKLKQLRVTFDFLEYKNHATIYHQALMNAFLGH